MGADWRILAEDKNARRALVESQKIFDEKLADNSTFVARLTSRLMTQVTFREYFEVQENRSGSRHSENFSYKECSRSTTDAILLL